MKRELHESRGLLFASCLLLGFAAAAQTTRDKPGPASLDSPAPLSQSPFIPNAVLTEGFDTVTGGCVSGWNCQNLSSPTGTTGWFQGDTAVFNAQAGAPNAYIAANFNNTLATNTISNWLITPQVNFNSGAQLRFWTRTSTGQFPDRLEVRISTNGASTNVGATNTSVGDFTTTLITINPSLLTGAGVCPPTTGSYPIVFCEIVLGNAEGLPTSGTGRIAFRYFMPNGGPTGANSLYIGIDTFSYDDAATTTETIYGVTGDSAGASLIRFMSNAPAAVTTIGALTGVMPGHALRAIDFRPADGRLYALSTNTSNGYQLYTVNLATAALTTVGPVGTVATTFPASVSMDFNPVADRLRVVTADVAGGGAAAARSYRINPNDGVLVAEDSALAYVAGDPSAGNNPPLPTGVAYDRNDNDTATATTLFAWDFRFDTLSRVGSIDGTPTSPNSGQLSTIFTQPTFLSGNAGLGFDVGASGVAYLSYVAFQPLAGRSATGTGGPETFARVNLSSGAVTVVGTFPVALNVLDISAQLAVPPAAADLIATLTDSPDPVAPGGDLSYTATATNNGPSPAAAVSISLPLPVGTGFVSALPSSGGTCSGVSTVVCSWVAATAPGAGSARSAVITASVPAGTATGTVFNATATVTTTSTDPIPANNSAAQASTVGNAAADLSITLADTPDPVTAGSNLNYAASLSNGGPNDAQNVSISLPLPAGTSFVSVAPSAGGVCNAVSPVVCSWAGTTIPGAVRSASILASVSPAQIGSLSATVTASTVTGDPNGGNNTATALTAVVTSANLASRNEAEPNDGFATATALPLTSGLALGNHAITPAGDLDFWSVTVIAGQRLWILTDTGGPQMAGATSTDTVMDLLASDGSTLIENDDDDGTGTGGDSSVESSFSSAIAGRTIAATGVHFIRVRSFNVNDIVNPIALFVARTAASDQTAEVEGNDTAPTANPIGTGLSVRTGSIGVVGDRDFYRLTAAAGDVIFYSADADPERDGTGTDLLLELRAADGTTILQSVNSSAIGSLADPAAEGSRFNVLTTGTYFIVAAHASATATGSYHLMVANGPPAETIYGVTGPSAGGNLIRFMSNAPATVTTIGALSGIVPGHSVRAIDFRPADGKLYALSTNTTTGYQLYSVNLSTAALTPIGPVGTVATAFPVTVSMDFNPAADRLRVVTADVAGGGFAPARSYRINPNDGVLAAEDTALGYVAGDPNVGNNPPVPTDLAYDRSDNDPATATTLFIWDFRFDTLARVGSVDGTPVSPNSGQLSTVFTQPVFLTGNVGLGFDVGAGAIAYLSYVAAAPTRGTGGPESLARINLATGAVTAIGTFPNGINVLDISAQLPVILGDSVFRNGFE